VRNDTLVRQRSRSSDQSERMTSNGLKSSSLWMSNSLSRLTYYTQTLRSFRHVASPQSSTTPSK
jgi:hypothetical protein